MTSSNGIKLSLLFLFVFVLNIPLRRANIAHFDDHWKSRQEAAKKAAHSAYDPNPHNVTKDLYDRVHKSLNETNASPDETNAPSNAPKSLNETNAPRRGLATKYTGDCLAANPIDRCWRCDPDWEANRKRLAQCVLGFGRKTRGGQDGEIYVVTDNTDSDLLNPKPGTLRYAVIQPEPLWIIFKHGMLIQLSQELMISSNKTIDGRGGHVHIVGGAGLTLQFVENVIIHGVHVHDVKPRNGGMIRDSLEHFGLRTRSDGDGISMFGATNIWIDHVSMSNCADGLIDAIEMCTAITVSNCHFTDHNDVMLFGASDSRKEDKIMQITIAFNHFGKRLIQRMPRCRWGFFHVVNNDYTHWEMYAIGGSKNPTIISQGNRFIAPPNPFAKEVTHRNAPESEWKNWLWTSEDDILQNGAFFTTSGDKSTMESHTRQEMITAKPGSYVRRLTRFAGALNCHVGEPC